MKNVIFDLGGVLIQWQPQKIVATFSENKKLQALLLKEVFEHQDWLDLDKGLHTESQAALKIAKRAGLEQQLILDLFVLTKQRFILIEQTAKLLTELSLQGAKLYVLSNMSVESYRYLTQRYAFFEHFDGIVISGQEKMIKPEPQLFALICNRYELNPKETLFLDDMKDNVVAAREFGLNSVLFSQHPTCYQLVRKLMNLA